MEHSSMGSPPRGCVSLSARSPPRRESSGTAAVARSVSELCPASLTAGSVDGSSHSRGGPAPFAPSRTDEADHTQRRSTVSSGREASTCAASPGRLAAARSPSGPGRWFPHCALKPLPSTVDERHAWCCSGRSASASSCTPSSPAEWEAE
eukprot:scaffold4312_cov101-Isochrysis_galbana.AAC.4